MQKVCYEARAVSDNASGLKEVGELNHKIWYETQRFDTAQKFIRSRETPISFKPLLAVCFLL